MKILFHFSRIFARERKCQVICKSIFSFKRNSQPIFQSGCTSCSSSVESSGCSTFLPTLVILCHFDFVFLSSFDLKRKSVFTHPWTNDALCLVLPMEVICSLCSPYSLILFCFGGWVILIFEQFQ